VSIRRRASACARAIEASRRVRRASTPMKSGG
jgi:hypothetical protein